MKLQQSIHGPVFLILLGVAFLVSQIVGWIPFWPLILIAVGVSQLVKRLERPNQGTVAPRALRRPAQLDPLEDPLFSGQPPYPPPPLPNPGGKPQ